MGSRVIGVDAKGVPEVLFCFLATTEYSAQVVVGACMVRPQPVGDRERKVQHRALRMR